MAVNGSGTTVPAVGNHTYEQGTVVNISATAAEGWQFTNWIGNVANGGSDSTTVTMTSDKKVMASFMVTPTPSPPPTPTPTPTPTPSPTPFVQVEITSPEDNSSTNNRLINVQGTVVSQNEIAQATITRDGESRPLELTYEGSGSYNYSFDTSVELHQGWNTITVTATDTDHRSGSDTIDVYANIPIIPIRIELTWDTANTDIDSHFIAPGYSMGDEFGDCYFGNMNPDWDYSGGSSAGDPQLDRDDTDGYGPEYTVLQAPPFNGIYQFKVDYFSGSVPTTATVRIWINDVLRFNQSRELQSTEDVWDCACISWPSGTVSAGPCVTPTPTPTPTPTFSLTVYSEGCCPIEVTWDGGNETVNAGGNQTFVIPQGITVTLDAQADGITCYFYYWLIDNQDPYYVNPQDVYMDANYEAWAYCGSGL
jgi:uncharacterized protein YfaP (DUF2135 family)